jgi:aldehyde:ferredoxin oxidoreductase
MKSAKNCYAGKILRIDLTSGSIRSEALGAERADALIGGRGIASKILYDEVPPEIGPFDPENLLIFAPGALHGTGVPAASRTTCNCASCRRA